MQQLLVQVPRGHDSDPPRTRPETTCHVAHGIRPGRVTQYPRNAHRGAP